MSTMERHVSDDSELGPLFAAARNPASSRQPPEHQCSELPLGEQMPPSDPGAGRETSIEAWRSTDRSRDRQRIVDHLRQLGAHGATREEISIDTGIALPTVCGRCNDLINLPGSAVYESSRRRPTRAGRMAVVLVYDPHRLTT